MKFTLIAEDDFESSFIEVSPRISTLEFSGESLDDILDEFSCFLKGAGFVFSDLIVVTREDIETAEEQMSELRDHWSAELISRMGNDSH